MRVNGQLVTNKSTINRALHCLNHTKDHRALDRLAAELDQPAINVIAINRFAVVWPSNELIDVDLLINAVNSGQLVTIADT